ncbi:MAG: DUF192 domain-containing protein [Burkholderiaceae bacterium]
MPGPAVAPARADEPARTARQAGQPRLPEVVLEAGMFRIHAELANTPETRTIGLMHRPALDLNKGMLFAFERAEVHCFWMKNTPLPLSIAFIDDNGQIVSISDMQPLSEDSHCPPSRVRFALEMEQGWFARKGLAPGTRLRAPGLFPPAR